MSLRARCACRACCLLDNASGTSRACMPRVVGISVSGRSPSPAGIQDAQADSARRLKDGRPRATAACGRLRPNAGGTWVQCQASRLRVAVRASGGGCGALPPGVRLGIRLPARSLAAPATDLQVPGPIQMARPSTLKGLKGPTGRSGVPAGRAGMIVAGMIAMPPLAVRTATVLGGQRASDPGLTPSRTSGRPRLGVRSQAAGQLLWHSRGPASGAEGRLARRRLQVGPHADSRGDSHRAAVTGTPGDATGTVWQLPLAGIGG